MGSDMDMYSAGSEDDPVFALPETTNSTETVSLRPAAPSPATNKTDFPPSGLHRKEGSNDTTEQPSVASSTVERTPQTLSRSNGHITFLDYLFVDDKLVGATLGKMSNMLDAYFNDR